MNSLNQKKEEKKEKKKVKEYENDRIESGQPSGMLRYREKYIKKMLTR